MLGEIRGEVRFKEPLSFHTSLRIGGPADIFVVPQDVEDVRLALGFAERDHLPVEIIGGGNNLLVRDRGIRGVVVKVEGCLGRAEFHGEEAVAGAGVGLSALIREAAALNLGGIECLVGIPATIGGAVAMNAGTADGWIGDFISAVYFLHPDGTLGEFKPGHGSFGYRDFAAPAGAVVVGARLQLHRRPQAEIQKDIKQRLKVKKATQPPAAAWRTWPSRRWQWPINGSTAAGSAGARFGWPAGSARGSALGCSWSRWAPPSPPAAAGSCPRRPSPSSASR